MNKNFNVQERIKQYLKLYENLGRQVNNYNTTTHIEIPNLKFT